MKVARIVSMLVGIGLTASLAQAQWSMNGNKIFYSNGKVGIGTNNPNSPLQVVSNIGASNRPTLLVKMTNTTPEGFNAAIRGINRGAGFLGIGVWGSHDGAGFGVYGTVGDSGSGVYGIAGSNGTGVRGEAESGGIGVYGAAPGGREAEALGGTSTVAASFCKSSGLAWPIRASASTSRPTPPPNPRATRGRSAPTPGSRRTSSQSTARSAA